MSWFRDSGILRPRLFFKSARTELHLDLVKALPPQGEECVDLAQPPQFTNPMGILIRQANDDHAVAEALADVLLDCVEGGASVGFMLPLPRSKAVAFWKEVLASAARGERIVLIAEDTASNSIVGTVQLILKMPDNQPHRADVAKMQVHRRARRRGVGAVLMRAIEAEARAAGKTLLVLDTVTGSEAERLYSRLGWQQCGTIPDYALWPQGGLCSTTIFYRQL